MPKFSQLKQSKTMEQKNKFILENIQKCNQGINEILKKYKCRIEFLPQFQIMPGKDLIDEAEKKFKE